MMAAFRLHFPHRVLVALDELLGFLGAAVKLRERLEPLDAVGPKSDSYSSIFPYACG